MLNARDFESSDGLVRHEVRPRKSRKPIKILDISPIGECGTVVSAFLGKRK
jgi:hypothetical protein